MVINFSGVTTNLKQYTQENSCIYWDCNGQNLSHKAINFTYVVSTGTVFQNTVSQIDVSSSNKSFKPRQIIFPHDF